MHTPLILGKPNRKYIFKKVVAVGEKLIEFGWNLKDGQVEHFRFTIYVGKPLKEQRMVLYFDEIFNIRFRKVN